MPFVIYADFESLLKKPPADKENQNIVQVHEAMSIGYYLKGSYDDSLSTSLTEVQIQQNDSCKSWPNFQNFLN